MAGRPLLFKTPEELEEKINAYFDYCDEGRKSTVVTPKGQVVEQIKPIPYTVEGLADWLDCDTRTIRNYGKSEAFFPTVSRAKTKIMSNMVERGLTNEYNAKALHLVLQAMDQAYNPTQHIEVTAETVEQRLRRLRETKAIEVREQAALPAPKSDKESVSSKVDDKDSDVSG